MGTLLTKLWRDPAYFQKTLAMTMAFLAVLLPTLPLGEFGAAGYWIGKLLLPVAVAVAARGQTHSGLTPDEAAKLRALIPAPDVLAKVAPPI